MSGFKGIAVRVFGATLLSAAVLATQIQPAAAQTFGGDSKISAFVDCNMQSHRATVSITVRESAAYKSSGLYFHLQVWAKARFETSYTFIQQRTTPLIKTWSKTSSGVWMNNPKNIFNTSFTGNVRANYDIAVTYWYGPPSSSWIGPRTFYLPGDGDSAIQQTAWDGLMWTSVPSGQCYL